MGLSVAGRTGPDFCLPGFRRLVATSVGPRPRAGEIFLQFTFERTREDDESPLKFVSKATTADDKLLVNADLGSYRLRPKCGVAIIAPVGMWVVAAWETLDTSNEQDTLWWTLLIPVGPWEPPPFYHRLKVLGGGVTFRGVPIAPGVDFSLPGSGADLFVADGPAAVQVGFNV